jgi:DNA-binding response OmpR family regulator
MRSALILQDDEQIARSLELYLRRECFASDVTSLGEEAILLALSHDYDILLIDFGLPDINGMEVTERIRAGGSRAPIVFFGYPDPEIAEKAYNRGADLHTIYPFNTQELMASIRALVRRYRSMWVAA